MKEMVQSSKFVLTSESANALHGHLMVFACLKEKLEVEFKAESVSRKISRNAMVRVWALRCKNFCRTKRRSYLAEKLLLENPEIWSFLDLAEKVVRIFDNSKFHQRWS